MAQSPLLGPEPTAPMPSIPGTDDDALGPSDLSDTGSDTRGAPRAMRPDLLNLDQDGRGSDIVGEADTDSTGTGEGLDATGSQVPDGTDIGPDRIVSADELAEEDTRGE